MKIDWRFELPQLAVLAGMFIAAATCWSTVPDRIPVHWNLAGEIDRYGGKFEGLLLVPLISLGLYGLLLLLPRIDPGRANYAGFWRAYTIIRCLLIGFMAVVYSAMLITAYGVPLAMGASFRWRWGSCSSSWGTTSARSVQTGSWGSARRGRCPARFLGLKRIGGPLVIHAGARSLFCLLRERRLA